MPVGMELGTHARERTHTRAHARTHAHTFTLSYTLACLFAFLEMALVHIAGREKINAFPVIHIVLEVPFVSVAIRQFLRPSVCGEVSVMHVVLELPLVGKILKPRVCA